ncbi:MAG: hypothetical protein FJ090_10985 [Deltaproteobacteria bacterium]|nr:hypothetical protein [Deltaproteobacteria bacterium]
MFLVLVLLSACTPSCEQVCEKLVACDNDGTERMPEAECTEACQEQQALYDDWTDVQKRDALDAELSCLYNATCDEVASGSCYDEDIWAF